MTMSAAGLSVHEHSPVRVSPLTERPRIDGKFFRVGSETFYVKGVTYGTFAPGPDGSHLPPPERVEGDFALISARGLNAVRLYSPPRPEMLDEAARWGLRLMIGLPWTQHVAFLDDARLTREIRRDVVARVREVHAHPAVLLFALGNEIPPSVVRWHGRERVERFLRELLDEARQAAPESCFTYVNYPPTEFLELEAFDVCAFNVYLHDPEQLRSYLARLQHVAGNKPLLLAEAGACSLHEGKPRQAELAATQVRAAFAEGLAGAFSFAWTDEWWRGGREIDDWAFGLVDRQRRPKPALAAATRAFAEAPFPERERRGWPKVSVVVCAYNAADTLVDCLASLQALAYPDYEVLVVNDGSRDATLRLARAHAGERVRVIDLDRNGGLSAARNVGLAHARGEIVAYTDADVRVDPEWLTYLVQPFLRSDVVGSGGPNVVPQDDPWVAQCVARAPGGPTHVLLDDRTAEHVPGCNMAFRREALLAIGGFNPAFLRAGDDVDVCWRLQARGMRIGFAPAALVWHHHRSSAKAYWRQQVGYGEGELWLATHHPDKFAGRHLLWRGRIYSPLPFVRSLSRRRVNAGLWGTAAFPSVYFTGAPAHSYLPHSVQWQAGSLALLGAGLAGFASPWPAFAALALALGAGLLATTAAKCWLHALGSDIHGLPAIPGRTPRASRLLYRGTIAWLHFIQPFARLRGLLRGLMNPPSPAAAEPAPGLPARRPGAGEVGSALRLLLGETLVTRFWGESWMGVEAVLGGFVKELRRSRSARSIEVDDGWSHDRDVSVGLGPWARLDLRALVEEHERGRVLLRVARRLRPTAPGVVALLGLAALISTVVAAGAGRPWSLASLVALALSAGATLKIFGRLLRASAALERAVARTASLSGLTPLEAPPLPLRGRLAWLRGIVATTLLGAVPVCVSALLHGALPATAHPTYARTIAPTPAQPAVAPPAGLAVSLERRTERRAPADRSVRADELRRRASGAPDTHAAPAAVVRAPRS